MIMRWPKRLLEPIGNIPPAEFEMAYYRQLKESANAARLKLKSLRKDQAIQLMVVDNFK